MLHCVRMAGGKLIVLLCSPFATSSGGSKESVSGREREKDKQVTGLVKQRAIDWKSKVTGNKRESKMKVAKKCDNLI